MNFRCSVISYNLIQESSLGKETLKLCRTGLLCSEIHLKPGFKIYDSFEFRDTQFPFGSIKYF